MRESFPGVEVVEDQHVVEDGHVLTSAGISAGIDLALRVVARHHGEAIARATARHMEYPYPTTTRVGYDGPQIPTTNRSEFLHDIFATRRGPLPVDKFLLLPPTRWEVPVLGQGHRRSGARKRHRPDVARAATPVLLPSCRTNIRRRVNGRPHWYAIRSGVAGLAESLDGDGVRFIPMSRPVRCDARLTDFIVREKCL